jgi:hypothetical protein
MTGGRLQQEIRNSPTVAAMQALPHFHLIKFADENAPASLAEFVHETKVVGPRFAGCSFALLYPFLLQANITADGPGVRYPAGHSYSARVSLPQSHFVRWSIHHAQPSATGMPESGLL